MESFHWLDFLREYNAELLASEHPADWLRLRGDEDLETAVRAGWLGYPGVGEEQLARAEERLGVTLSPSYRAFLQTSNGWRWPGTFVPRLWAVEEIDWFRVTDRDTVEIWSEGNPELGDQLKGALRISEQEIGGTAVYLLQPGLVTGDSECEAWLFAHWIPGETRYRSFRELMEGERRSFLELETLETKRMLPGEGPAQLAAKLPNLIAELEGKAVQYREIAQRQPVGARFVAAGTAVALEEVAERVRRVRAQNLPSEALLASLRALEQEAAQEHRATHERQTQNPGAIDWLRLVLGARGMARAEGLRQAAGLIEWFIKDAGDCAGSTRGGVQRE